MGAAVAAATMSNSLRLDAETLPLPLGLQLYSLREYLPKDWDGTLHQIGALGYREVEAAGFFGHTAAQVKQSMTSAGLKCVSAHYPYAQLAAGLDDILHFGQELGLQYIICSSPGLRQPVEAHRPHPPLTLDDWRWNAEQFNSFGEKVKSAGMQFGYHNHVTEFRAENGVLPYDELLRLTDPAKVTLELDCGWMTVGGQNPVQYLTKYPHRFSMLHVKDFNRNQPVTSTPPPAPTELGRGSIDYRPIFRAAVKAHIRHCFVEQEGFDVPPWESLKIDADYIRNLKF